MCNGAGALSGAPTTPRVRWDRLYGIVGVMSVGLTSVEFLGPAGIARAALRGTVALGAFAAMALWVRANRAAFDYEDWCECAAEKITVRVIPSRRPEPDPPTLEDDELQRVLGHDREQVLT
jgi:hypothetical protein